VFLNHFDPADISADVMVDREDDVTWLSENFESYFDAIERRTLGDTDKRIVCVTGDKGMGKSILAGKVIQELRKKYSGSTLFVSVDCRGTNGARGVVASIASGLVEEISTFQPVVAAGGRPYPDWLPALASELSNIAHADKASSKTVHERLTKLKGTLKLGGQKMLGMLKAEWGISLDAELRDVRTLESAIDFDIDRVFTLTTKLFQDIRAAGLRVFLLVDNVDELQHEYWDEDARKNTHATVKRVLTLTEAPIAMLLCMRTYFQSILPRVVGVPRAIQPLLAPQLLEIAKHRIHLEAEPAQRALRSDKAQTMIAALARHAGTPLAFLTWVKWVAESREGFDAAIDKHAESWRGARYVDFRKAVARALELFAEKRADGDDAVARKDLIAAIGGDEDALRYLQDSELILPRDFWNPTHFVLDPTAAWIAEPHA
jgi:hypothetical protein